jgi:alkylation response protein AidB-like acyl-CoA dehydrogenase
VDLNLTEDQELFLDTTGKFLRAKWPMTAVRGLSEGVDGFDRLIWEQGAELGWTSLLVPEEYGGGSVSAAPVMDLSMIAEELGKFLVAGPVLPTNVVALALAEAGPEGLAKEHLPRVASGEEIVAWAVAEGGARWGADARGVTAVVSGDGFVLSGTKTPVQDAGVAEYLLVSAETDGGVSQFLVARDTPGLEVVVLGSLDLARRFCRVSFDQVYVPAAALVGGLGQAGEGIERQLALMVALQCAETVGAADRAVEMTLAYVKDRRSFGRPIGSYQALKHRLVDMVLWLESSKAATAAAVAAVQFGVEASAAASVAKAYVGDRCPVILRECLQLHGGIGYTWEHDLHFFMRRVETNAALYGTADYHRDRLAPTIGL